MSKELAKQKSDIPVLAKGATVSHNLFSIRDEEGKKVIHVSEKFKVAALSAVNVLDTVMMDVTPIATNLYSAWILCKDKGIGWLQFVLALDPTFPWKQNPPVSDTKARKEFNAHKVNNRLSYLVHKVGKNIVNPPKPADPKVAQKKKDAKYAALAETVQKYKISPAAFAAILRSIGGYVTKSGDEFTKTAVTMLDTIGELNDSAKFSTLAKASIPKTITIKAKGKKK